MNLADRKLCERTEALLALLEPITHRQQGALMTHPHDDYEPDPPEPDFEPDEEPLEEPTEIPADWVEGHDDNSASERGSHWEDPE